LADSDGRKLVGFRLNDKIYREFQIYLLKRNTTFQECMEKYVLELLRRDKKDNV